MHIEDFNNLKNLTESSNNDMEFEITNAIVDYLEDVVYKIPDYICSKLQIDPETYKRSVANKDKRLEYSEDVYLAICNLADILAKPYLE